MVRETVDDVRGDTTVVRKLSQNGYSQPSLSSTNCKGSGQLNETAMASAPYGGPSLDITQARSDFLKLTAATAQRMFRFWLVRGVAKADT